MADRRCFYDCRAKADCFKELLLLTSAESLKTVKGLRSADYQACCDIYIPQLPSTEEDFVNGDVGMLVQVNMRSSRELWYDRVIIMREQTTNDVSGILGAVQEYCPELLEQQRLFVTEFKAPIDVDEFHRALGAAQPVLLK